MSRGDYDRLPTEAEEHKAIKDSVEAEEAQKPKAPEKKKPGDTPEPADRPEEKKPAVHVETEEEKKAAEEKAEESKPVLDFVKETLGDKIKEARISKLWRPILPAPQARPAPP